MNESVKLLNYIGCCLSDSWLMINPAAIDISFNLRHTHTHTHTELRSAVRQMWPSTGFYQTSCLSVMSSHLNCDVIKRSIRARVQRSIDVIVSVMLIDSEARCWSSNVAWVPSPNTSTRHSSEQVQRFCWILHKKLTWVTWYRLRSRVLLPVRQTVLVSVGSETKFSVSLWLQSLRRQMESYERIQ